MQIEWMWLIICAGAVLGGFVFGGIAGYNKGVRDGAKDYGMIREHLRAVLDSREDADIELELIRSTINAIKEGSE